MSGRSVVFAIAACAFLAGVILQVFLAGMGAFKLGDWTAHAGFGWMLASIPLLVLLPLAFLARADTRTRWLTLLLTIAAAFQPELAGARETNPVLAAVHPVNALLIFWLALQIARNAIRAARRSGSSMAQPVARDAGEASSSDVAA